MALILLNKSMGLISSQNGSQWTDSSESKMAPTLHYRIPIDATITHTAGRLKWRDSALWHSLLTLLLLCASLPRCEVDKDASLEPASLVGDVVVRGNEEFQERHHLNDKEDTAPEVSISDNQVRNTHTHTDTHTHTRTHTKANTPHIQTHITHTLWTYIDTIANASCIHSMCVLII